VFAAGVEGESGVTLTTLGPWMHAPVASQDVAHAIVQQLPVPAAPQIPETHWLFPMHAEPSATLGKQLPPLQKSLDDVQSVSCEQLARQEVASAQFKPLGHEVGVPAVQEPVPLHELTVSVLPVQVDPQAVELPGPTHAPVASQLVAPHVPVVLHVAVQQFPVPIVPQIAEIH
jgi:hypothetical protein